MPKVVSRTGLRHCPHCLSVFRENGSIELPRAAVARSVELLERAHADGRLRDDVFALAEDPDRALLLRLPLVFERARHAFGRHVKLRVPADVLGQTRLERMAPLRLDSVGGGAVVRAPAGPGAAFATEILTIGTRFEVVGAESAELLLDRRPGRLGALDAATGGLSRVTSPLDLLSPDD